MRESWINQYCASRFHLANLRDMMRGDNDRYNDALTCLGYISTRGDTQLDVSRAASRTTGAANSFRVQQHVGHPLTLPAENGN